MPQNQDHSEETAHTGEGSSQPASLQRSPAREKGARKVAKTMLFNQPDTQNTEETERPGKKKVAKTLLFKTDFVSEIAKHIAEQTTSQVEDIDHTDLDDYLEESLSAPAPEEKATRQPRKVKKTLLEAEMGDLLSSPESLNAIAAEVKSDKPLKVEKPAQARKVKKTLLEAEMGDLLSSPESLTSHTDQAASAPSPSPDQIQAEERALSQQEIEVPAQLQNEPTAAIATPAQDQTQPPAPSKRYVAKTRLDHSILYDTVIKAAEKLEQQATEQAKQKALEPVKPFIPVEAKKKAMPCHWSWNDPEPCEKFQYCGICQTPIYNFNDMELPEAEALIFQRENLKKPTLYKRHDGKFMTKDCPVAVKRRKDTITYTLIGIVVTAAVVFVLATLPPPPKPPTPVITETAPPPPPTTPPTHTTSSQPNGKPGTSSDGSFHYEGGKITTQPIAPPPEPVAPPPPTRQEETGEFWQFPAGQNQ